LQSPKEEHRYLVGLDLGQANDYTALGILHQKFVESRHRFEYELPYLERVRGMPYPLIVDKVEALLKKPELQASEPPLLIIDKTGVGAPVCDMFKGGRQLLKIIQVGMLGVWDKLARFYANVGVRILADHISKRSGIAGQLQYVFPFQGGATVLLKMRQPV
jgi:hypothetical protein